MHGRGHNGLGQSGPVLAPISYSNRLALRELSAGTEGVVRAWDQGVYVMYATLVHGPMRKRLSAVNRSGVMG